MAGQYQQNNINVPRKTQVFRNTGAIPQILDLDSDFVIAESDISIVILQLPTANQIPSQTLSLKARDAGTNPVTLIPSAGELIDGLASVSLTSDQESIILKSAGQSQGVGYFWQIISRTIPTADPLPAISRVQGSTARGSVNTNIYRWTAEAESVGASIIYTDSVNDGGYWTIVNDGTYSISVSQFASPDQAVAIKVSQVLSNVFNEPAAIRMYAFNTNDPATDPPAMCLSWTGPLVQGDIIWIACSDAVNPIGASFSANVTVTRVA